MHRPILPIERLKVACHCLASDFAIVAFFSSLVNACFCLLSLPVFPPLDIKLRRFDPASVPSKGRRARADRDRSTGGCQTHCHFDWTDSRAWRFSTGMAGRCCSVVATRPTRTIHSSECSDRPSHPQWRVQNAKLVCKFVLLSFKLPYY